MEILFVRHGESTANRAWMNNEEYDRKNIVLTDKGIEQAQASGKYIKKVFGKIDCIYHSPIYRCKQTAEIIAKNMKFKKPLVPNELLLEVGEKSLLDDMSFAEIKKKSQLDNKEYIKNDKILNPFIKLEKRILINKKIEKKYQQKPTQEDVYNNYNIFLNQIKNEKNKRILVIGNFKLYQKISNFLI
jgi:broad specificity phosphatase PhoE